MDFAPVGVKCKPGVMCFNSSAVLVDNFVFQDSLEGKIHKPLAAIHSDNLRFLTRQRNISMILKKTVLLIITVSISTFLQAQQLFTKDQQEVQQVVVKMFEALSNRDSVSLKAHCAADITLYEYGQIWNIDTLINKAITLNTVADFKRTNTFEFISTERDKNIAWVTYRLTSVITKDSTQTTVQWLETVILAKQKKHWKVKHLHSTLIKRG